jgi:hypothetical protein
LITGSGQSHISTICAHGPILEVRTIHKHVHEIVVKLQHPELGVLKLDGNSSYGKTFTNKERHTDVIYYQEHQVSRYLDDPSFRRCNQLSAKTFEVEMSKKTIRLDLPMQIGCFVYQYSKLRMLEFYYDFMYFSFVTLLVFLLTPLQLNLSSAPKQK